MTDNDVVVSRDIGKRNIDYLSERGHKMRAIKQRWRMYAYRRVRPIIRLRPN